MPATAVKTQGIKVSIGTTATDAATDTYVPINGVTAITEIGAQANSIDATSLEDTARQKLKGIPDYGEASLTLIELPADAGQIAAKAAAAASGAYNFRIEYDNDPTPGSGNGTRYTFKALVLSFRHTGVRGTDDKIMASCRMAITGAVTYTAAS